MQTFPALGLDPAPGTLASAEEVAERVRTTAASIREAADVLAGVGQQDWQGETATAFHESMSQELTPQVTTAAESFAAAAAALETWASSLAGFQQQAVQLEARAAGALAAVEHAAGELATAQLSDDPDVDTEGPAARLDAATGELEAVRGEAHALLETYHSQAEYVAACLTDAAAQAPDKSWWESFTGWVSDIHDWVQDYLLPALEDLVDILGLVVAAAAVVALLLTPFGWAAAAAVLGKVALGLAVTAVAIDAVQWAGGREDASEMVAGALGLLAGWALGSLVSKLGTIAQNHGGLSGLVPVLAGGSTSAGGGAVATAALSFDPVGPLASWGYIYGRTHEETQNVVDTVEGINEAGDMWSRTAERFQNLFGGHGFVTEEQQEAVRAREAAQ